MTHDKHLFDMAAQEPSWLDEAMKLAEDYARAWQHDADGNYVIKDQAPKVKDKLRAHLALACHEAGVRVDTDAQAFINRAAEIGLPAAAKEMTDARGALAVHAAQLHEYERLHALAHAWAQECYFKGLGRPARIDETRGSFQRALRGLITSGVPEPRRLSDGDIEALYMQYCPDDSLAAAIRFAREVEKRALGVAASPAPSRDELTAMIDAAMVEMSNIHPPLRRSECERLIRAALGVTEAHAPKMRRRLTSDGNGGMCIVTEPDPDGVAASYPDVGFYRSVLLLIVAVEDRFGLEKARELAREALAHGVPAFDATKPCLLTTADPTRTYCERCKNPHHACDTPPYGAVTINETIPPLDGGEKRNDPAGVKACPACGGNDKDAPCAFPEGGQPGCLRDARIAGVALPAPLGWWTDELEKIYTAKAGTPITLDMKRAAHMALTVARGGRWDDEKQEWTHGVPASDGETK